jgi:hypothetical protein
MQNNIKILSHSQCPLIDAPINNGILIKLQGVYEGKEWNMSPDTSGITKADLGIYHLRSIGEKVENLDYLCTWKVQNPKKKVK